MIIARREFIALVGGAVLTWPIAGRAQQNKVVRIGALYIGLADAESFRHELREGLRELGYVEGKNIALEFRSAEGRFDRLPGLAAELVRLKVDLIVALYVPSALAAKRATRDIPIVFIAADPVETGIVSSLARPDGNITGVSLMSAESTAKNIELFHDMLPSVKRVGVLVNAANPVYATAMLDKVLLAGGATGIDVRPVVWVREPDELESAFTTFVREQVGALVVQGDLAIKPVADMAVKYRVPAASTTRAFVDVGGLMSFGADGPSSVRHGTKFVQRICRVGSQKTYRWSNPRLMSLSSISRLRRPLASRFRTRSCGVPIPCSNKLRHCLPLPVGVIREESFAAMH